MVNETQKLYLVLNMESEHDMRVAVIELTHDLLAEILHNVEAFKRVQKHGAGRILSMDFMGVGELFEQSKPFADWLERVDKEQEEVGLAYQFENRGWILIHEFPEFKLDGQDPDQVRLGSSPLYSIFGPEGDSMSFRFYPKHENESMESWNIGIDAELIPILRDQLGIEVKHADE